MTSKKVKIEKDVPIGKANRKYKLKYPFDEMAVGESFFVAVPKDRVVTTRANAMCLAIHHGKNNGKKFSSRFCEGGFRIWRTK
jgi:hypothetical protein